MDIDVIERLPDDLLREIYKYLPITVLVFLNKTNYQLYHRCIKKQIPQFESYIRDTVRRDNEFVFLKILEENCKIWVNIKKYYYQNKIFCNYLYFMVDYCIEQDADKCRVTLNEFCRIVGLGNNQHKKNIIRHIKWRK